MTDQNKGEPRIDLDRDHGRPYLQALIAKYNPNMSAIFRENSFRSGMTLNIFYDWLTRTKTANAADFEDVVSKIKDWKPPAPPNNNSEPQIITYSGLVRDSKKLYNLAGEPDFKPLNFIAKESIEVGKIISPRSLVSYFQQCSFRPQKNISLQFGSLKSLYRLYSKPDFSPPETGEFFAQIMCMGQRKDELRMLPIVSTTLFNIITGDTTALAPSDMESSHIVIKSAQNDSVKTFQKLVDQYSM